MEVVDRVRGEVDPVAVDVRDRRAERDDHHHRRGLERGEDERCGADDREGRDQVDPVAGEDRQVVEDEDGGRERHERRLGVGDTKPAHEPAFRRFEAGTCPRRRRRGATRIRLVTRTEPADAPAPGARAPDRNLALELVRVTEAAAMAAGRWVGRGDKNGGDGAAVDAMRTMIGTVSMRGVGVIGGGEKDQAPMLYNGEPVGAGPGAECDVAVDPIDGTTLMAKGMPNAIAVIAVSERGAMFDPSAVFYMEKIAVGSEAIDAADITAS